MVKMQQYSLSFPNRWGGARPGAGAKKKKGAEVSHLTREPQKARHPVHVTAKLQKGLPSPRRKRAYREVLRCFEAGKERFGSRRAHFSIQSNHLHLIVEAEDRRALSRGLQGLFIRIAKAMNRL